MKFAVAALIASTSAIRIQAQGKGCVTKKLAAEGFKALDTNHNGSLSYEEIKVGLEELAKSLDHTVTKEEWEWIEKTGEKIDSKTPGKVDEKEFHQFANAVFKHFGLCHLAREAEGKHVKQKCVDHKLAAEGFKALDTNHNGSLSYDEIKVGLEDLAKSQHHTITKEEWEWIEKTGKRIDSKTPGKVDEKEFYRFANAVFRHFDLCHLAREAEHKEEKCVDHKLADEGFKALDTDHSGSLSYDEIKVGLEELAKSQHHVITKEEWEWIEKTGEKIDSKTPGKVDHEEFYEFANAVFRHFGLCHLAREAERADHV
jgi:Ca2+-binding EF-hand superfamily protein